MRRAAVLAMVLVTGALLPACGSSGKGAGGPSTAGVRHGGSMTVLEDAGFGGTWATGLDPGTSTTAGGNTSLMDAIYGGLFELGRGGRIIGDLATGYQLRDGGRTVVIHLRHGVTFQDGTPFDAQAVAWNIRRDLKSPCTCSPSRIWPALDKRAPVTTSGRYAVALHFTQPDAAAIDSFIDAAPNWIASPTAVKKLGEGEFRLKPVGAGPFKVVSDKLSAKLALTRFTGYWQKGHPYLDNLTFVSVQGDESAYEAMLAGQGQAYEEVWAPSIMKTARAHFNVEQQQSTQPAGIQLNTSIPPFNNKLAREAMYYATDSQAIATHLFNGMFGVSESFTGPGSRFYRAKVPGYRTYDPARAKAIVSRLGGLKIVIDTPNELPFEQMAEALQSQWERVGIRATIRAQNLELNIQDFQSGKWQAFLQPIGSWDPTAAMGVAFRFGSRSPFSGVHDPKLDALLAKATSTLDATARRRIVDQTAKYISDQAYAPFVLAFATAPMAAKGVSGPGLTSPLPAIALTPQIRWEDVASR